MSFTASGTIEIDTAEFFTWVYQNYAPAKGVEYQYGVPRVNKDNHTIEIDFAMATDSHPKDWANVVKQWEEPDQLKAIAHAASDLLCGMKFPRFAEEHGGVETLTKDLSRLVDRYEEDVDPSDGWLPIETAPAVRLPFKMFVVIAMGVKVTESSPPYTSDPYCVWKDPDGSFARWPHPFQPTHWRPLPIYGPEFLP
jgi:hypothetical protein